MKIKNKDQWSLVHFPSGRIVLSNPRGENWHFSPDKLEELKNIFLSDSDIELHEFVYDHEFSRIKDVGVLKVSPVIHKKENGELLFYDRGSRITFDREYVPDEEIILALVHAQKKFGNKINLTGDCPIFMARMAKLADDMGLTILNPEMQPIIAAHRAAMANNAPSLAPPMPPKKRGLWQHVLTLLWLKKKPRPMFQ